MQQYISYYSINIRFNLLVQLLKQAVQRTFVSYYLYNVCFCILQGHRIHGQLIHKENQGQNNKDSIDIFIMIFIKLVHMVYLFENWYIKHEQLSTLKQFTFNANHIFYVVFHFQLSLSILHNYFQNESNQHPVVNHLLAYV